MTKITVYGHNARKIKAAYQLFPKQSVTMPVSITYYTVEGRDKIVFKLHEETATE